MNNSITASLSSSNSSPLINELALSPTKESMEQEFWGLGDRFWMQFIDGKYHKFGSRVFDEGLHKQVKEPGYLGSLREGAKFASEYLGDKLSLHFYKELHKRLCQHFRGRENFTLMSSGEAGLFGRGCIRALFNIKGWSEEAIEHYDLVSSYKSKKYLEFLKTNDFQEYQKICDQHETSEEWIKKYESYYAEKTVQINEEIKKRFAEFHRKREEDLVTIHYRDMDQAIVLNYNCAEPEELDRIVQALFDNYHLKISAINSERDQSPEISNRQKTEAIAELFQSLDWLHPFPDGQGRTDLVLLSKLLVEEGLNPPILDEPYMSSYSTLEEWVEYLIKGMEAWRKERG